MRRPAIDSCRPRPRAQRAPAPGELQATLLLTYVLQEAGPAVYNKAVADAQARMMHHVTDLPAECYEPEVD